MICPVCHSENIQIQAKKSHNPVIVACVLLLGGIGLMFLGIIGLLIGLVTGLIIGGIVKAIMPTTHESIAVCQKCGNIFNPSEQPVSVSSVFQDNSSENTDNLTVVRPNSSCGSIVTLSVRVDSGREILLGNDRSFSIFVPSGDHTLAYKQINGAGKKKRTGVYRVFVKADSTKTVYMTLTPKGIDIREN